MTYPKIKPCPKCGSDSLGVYKYDHGARRVECSMSCGYMGPACTSIGWAIKHHNAERDERARAFAKLEPKRSEDIIREDRDEWDARLEGWS